jgi:hypothetical protein
LPSISGASQAERATAPSASTASTITSMVSPTRLSSSAALMVCCRSMRRA